MTDLDYLTLYKNETGCSPFTWVDGYEKLTWQYYEWKINYITTDRDRLQAEVKNYEECILSMEKQYAIFEKEFEELTARCKAAEEDAKILSKHIEDNDAFYFENEKVYEIVNKWLTLKKE